MLPFFDLELYIVRFLLVPERKVHFLVTILTMYLLFSKKFEGRGRGRGKGMTSWGIEPSLTRLKFRWVIN